MPFTKHKYILHLAHIITVFLLEQYLQRFWLSEGIGKWPIWSYRDPPVGIGIPVVFLFLGSGAFDAGRPRFGVLILPKFQDGSNHRQKTF